MKAATLANAKSHLSAPISDVEAGEDVVVTRRRKPVARLVPEPRSRNFDSADLRDSVSVPPTPSLTVAEMREQELIGGVKQQMIAAAAQRLARYDF